MAGAFAQLGQSNDPRALVPGDPAALRSHATALVGRGNTLTQVGDRLRGVDTSQGWSGKAASAFQGKFQPYPGRLLALGNAHHDAARSVSQFADVLEWAQGQADRSAQIWGQAEATTAQAADVYDKSAAAGIRQGPFADPGAALRTAAQEDLARARDQVTAAGNTAASTISAAAETAPTSPSLISQIGGGIEGAAADTINGTASWLNAAAHNLPALGEVAGGTVLAAGGALVTAGSGLLDAGVLTAPAGVAAGAGGITMIGGGLSLASHGLGTIASHATSDDQVTPVGSAALTMPFGKKQDPPKPSEKEKEALAAKAAGEKFDPKLAKAAEKKEATGEKFRGERNVQKREDNKRGK